MAAVNTTQKVAKMATVEYPKIKYVTARSESEKADEIESYITENHTGDCVASAFTHATGKHYDEIANHITNITNEKYAVKVRLNVVHNLVKDFDFVIIKFVRYSRVKTVSDISLTYKNCIALCGKTRDKPSHAVAIIDGVIHDSWDSSQYCVNEVYILKPTSQKNKSHKPKTTDKNVARKDGKVIGNLEELTDKVLKAKRENPKLSWVKLINSLQLLRQDGYKIRRSSYFQNQLTENEKGWALKPAK